MKCQAERASFGNAIALGDGDGDGDMDLLVGASTWGNLDSRGMRQGRAFHYVSQGATG